jgi:hypothetical protein
VDFQARRNEPKARRNKIKAGRNKIQMSRNEIQMTFPSANQGLSMVYRGIADRVDASCLR